MKPRHAAALVLCGWYLIVPPFNKSGPLAGTPLSLWTDHEGSYDTARECDQGKQALLDDLDKHQAFHDYRAAVIFARCIASDDPRLKEK